MFKQVTTITALYAYGKDKQKRYHINKLDLNVSLYSGYTCSFALTGLASDTTGSLDTSNQAISDIYSVGDTVTICMEYVQGDKNEKKLCYVASGRVLSLNHTFAVSESTYAQVTVYTIADDMQFISTTPIGRIYTYNAVEGENSASRLKLLTKAMSGSLWTELRNTVMSGKYFNIPLATASLLNRIIEAPKGSKTLKITDVVDMTASPTLHLNPSCGAALLKELTTSVNSDLSTSPPATLFKYIIGRYFLTLGYYRDGATGKWKIVPIPDMPWDKRVVTKDVVTDVLSSRLAVSGCPDDSFDAVAVRYASIASANARQLVNTVKLSECAICVETSTNASGGQKVSKIVEMTINPATTGDTQALKDTDALPSKARLITLDIPGWIKWVYAPDGKLDNTTIDTQYQKKWAKMLARAYYALHNRERSTLTIGVPILQALDMTCTALGRVVGVLVPMSSDITANKGTKANYYGRVTGISISISIDKNFAASARVDLSHVRTATEQNNLSVDCSELLKLAGG